MPLLRAESGRGSLALLLRLTHSGCQTVTNTVASVRAEACHWADSGLGARGPGVESAWRQARRRELECKAPASLILSRMHNLNRRPQAGRDRRDHVQVNRDYSDSAVWWSLFPLRHAITRNNRPFWAAGSLRRRCLTSFPGPTMRRSQCASSAHHHEGTSRPSRRDMCAKDFMRRHVKDF